MKRDFEKVYTYHPPTPEQTSKYEEIRNLAKAFAERMEVLCPEGWEKSLAHTKLEEAVMWANAAIARG